MDHEHLKSLKIAILVADGFEQVELVKPRQALNQAGAETRIVSPKGERVRGWNFTDWGDEFPVDIALDRAQPDEFDALLLPGGVMNPDALRMQARAADRFGAVASDRSPERRCAVGGSGGRGRWQPGIEPQARRPPSLQPGDD
jgi:putative intracellular protease/amidase